MLRFFWDIRVSFPRNNIIHDRTDIRPSPKHRRGGHDVHRPVIADIHDSCIRNKFIDVRIEALVVIIFIIHVSESMFLQVVEKNLRGLD